MIDLAKVWSKRKIMPVITVDSYSGHVLMLGYMNKEAFAYTLKTHRVWYYDIESGEVSMKGKHSGNTQRLISMKADYDCKSLLLTVEQKGDVCSHDGGHDTYFLHTIYGREEDDVAKRKKFGRVEIDEDFDYSKEDYSDEYEIVSDDKKDKKDK